MAEMRSHEPLDEPDPNETASRFGLDPERERAGPPPRGHAFATRAPRPSEQDEEVEEEEKRSEDELVDETGRESFPASDPPAF